MLRKINYTIPVAKQQASFLKRAFHSINTIFNKIYSLTMTSISQICYTKEQNPFFFFFFAKPHSSETVFLATSFYPTQSPQAEAQ